MSRGVWEAVETGAREVGIGETRERRKKGENREKEGGKRKEEKTKKGKNYGSKESSGGMRNIE